MTDLPDTAKAQKKSRIRVKTELIFQNTNQKLILRTNLIIQDIAWSEKTAKRRHHLKAIFTKKQNA